MLGGQIFRSHEQELREQSVLFYFFFLIKIKKTYNKKINCVVSAIVTTIRTGHFFL